MTQVNSGVKAHTEEIELKAMSGMVCLIMNIIAVAAACAAFVFSVLMLESGGNTALAVILMIVGSVYGFIVGPIIFIGLRVLKPNEAFVLTLFGHY